MPKAVANREPRTKGEFLSRMLSFDFDGSIFRQSKRTGPSRVEITMPQSGVKFEVLVRRPKTGEALKKAQERGAALGAAAKPQAGKSDGKKRSPVVKAGGKGRTQHAHH